jgi:phosphoesterase RecJ-like protein
MNKKLCKDIYKKIKQYDKIVIARHIGPDPDSLCGQIGLKDIILNAFPNKKVYVVGVPVSKFKFMGSLDKMTDEYYEDALLIALDTPIKSRLDGVDLTRFKESIKIDHHPYIETFSNIEWIDDSASSVCQMITELCFNSKLKLTNYASERLFMGIVADTNRFLFDYTTVKTFDYTKRLIETANLDIASLYSLLYCRSLNEVKFEGYVAENFTITENGVGYIILKADIIKEYNVDVATAGNVINNFNYINEFLVWLAITEDTKQNIIKVNIRSRGPIINLTAEEYNGGGHKYASGARLSDYNQVDELIKSLDTLCKEYKEKNNK